MKTVGEILIAKRKELGLSLETAEKETKIHRRFLEAIEHNRFNQIAEGTIVKGFVRNYAQFLGLFPENVLAVFRRDFCENEKGEVIPRAAMPSFNPSTWSWTPKMTVAVGVFLIVAAVGLLLAKGFLNISAPPILEIISPKEGQVFKEKILVSGKTDKDATVKIEGSVVSLDEDGSFKEEVVLPRGENTLTIEASNRQGKKRVESVKVKVE